MREPVAPDIAYLSVAVLTTGGDLNANGYSVVVDQAAPRKLSGDSLRVRESFSVSPGPHTLRLSDVAANCVVNGANPRTVNVASHNATETTFEVTCSATGFAITTRTTGPDSPSTISLQVDGQPPLTIPANGPRDVTQLTQGSHTIALQLPTHCTIVGGNPITVDVVANAMTTVSIEIVCTQVVRLEKIAYVNLAPATGSGRWIDVVNVDGTGATARREGDSPTWSPDRTQLAYSRTICGHDDYYDVDYCNSVVRSFDPELGNEFDISGGGFNPSWARTVDVLTFEISGFATDTKELVVRSIVEEEDYYGEKVKALRFRSLDIPGPRSKERPALSPDGRRIAFVCKWAQTADLCIVDADGRGLVRLTNDVGRDDRPAWSPDGTRIAFTRYPADRTDDASADIVVMNLATSQITTLTRGTDAAWSPDGSRLVFAGGDGLFIIASDGTNLRRLTTGSHRAPAWRP